MFGFLRLANQRTNDHQRYRQLYAAFCAHHRARHGVAASLLLSYEAIFLLQLAIDAGATSPPSAVTPTCCKLRSDPSNRWGIDRSLADYCSDFGMLLVRIKIDDDVRDSGKLTSKIAASIFRKPIHRSGVALERVLPNLSVVTRQIVDRHLQMEKNRTSSISIDAYAAPTADGFAMLFGGFAKCSTPLHREQQTLEKIGAAIGGAIIATDCCTDLARDRKTGDFNPLKNQSDFKEARHFALGCLSTAGFLCHQLAATGETQLNCLQKISTLILSQRFEMVRDLAYPHSQTTGPAIARRSLRSDALHGLRAGDCDCGGCDACCDIGCAGDVCCSPDAGNCHHCGFGCPCPCDAACDDGRKTNKTAPDKPFVADKKTETMVGQNGVVVASLSPTGVIEIDGTEHPAKSESQFIDAGVQVRVIEHAAFGLIVRKTDE